MTDRVDPFEDLEFDALDAVPAGVSETVPAVPAPTPAPAPAVAAAAATSAAAPVAEPAAPQAVEQPKGLLYATLGMSALAFMSTIAVGAVVLVTASAEPKAAPGHDGAALQRIEALLADQRKRTEALAAVPAATGSLDQEGLSAIASAVHANQQVMERLPQAVVGQLDARLARLDGAVRGMRPGGTVVRQAPSNDAALRQVMRDQAALKTQLDALGARMAKTAAACTTQANEAIRYP